MDRKIKKFLWGGFSAIIVICVVVFVWLTVFMSKKTQGTIVDISDIYMSEMNLQLQQKFHSITSLRLEQVDGIILRTPTDTAHYGSDMLRELSTSAEVRNFDYLGFYTPDGELTTIYGKEMEISNHENFQKALEKNESVVEQGVDEDGEHILLLGQAAGYPMKDGTKSIAIVAGISMEYLNNALFLDTEGATVFSHIIDKDGEFIIRNSGEFRDSYYDRIREKFEVVDGKTPEVYARELREAIEANEDYSTLICVDGEKRHIYCSPISGYSEWYLITVMPHGVLENVITRLDSLRMVVIFISLSVIVITMIIVFIIYFRLTQKQVEALNEARQEAVCANQAKSEFLSSMSHDIRTPMNAIIGMSEIALKNINDPQRVEDCLKKVQLSSKHLLGLINDVLDMSKIESKKVTLNRNRLSLRETMDDIVSIMQPQVKARKQFFDIFIHSILAEEVYCDGVRLNQVLLNLLSNAVKFTPQEGRIDVRVCQEASPAGEKYVRTHFVVEDNGIGMSEEFQKIIFETFSRENTEVVQNISGTGLGMAITKSIISLMGGTITLQSQQGKGSKFHVILDLEKFEDLREMKLPNWNVLVVDDNEELCTSAAANLKELGIHAEWTQSGEDAIQMVEGHHEQHNDYRFVLIDWKMPGMDGLDTIHEIQRRVGKKIPVFLISSYDWSEIEEEVEREDIEGFISKPLFKSTLYDRLSQYTETVGSEPVKQGVRPMDFTGRRVLVAEDIDINWEIANDILTSFGLELERAVNGKECVEMLEASEIGFYDAVLMDIRMPVMNGYDATKAIRKLERADRNLPIIAMTADAFSNDVEYCLECGMNAHVAKPLDVMKLLQVLQEFLGQAS